MKISTRFFLCLLGAWAVSNLMAAELNTLTPAERSAGWKLLFDGTTIAGWRSLKSEAPGAGWSAVGGTLTTVGQAGDLVTTGEYGNFELSLDWKVSEGANSGIIYRVGLTEDATYRTGPEYQVLDNLKAEDNKQANHLAGALYDLVAPPKDFTKPVGQWNTARLVVRGWHVQQWLNGEKTVDIDLASPAGKALIAGSKFKTMPKFATLLRGHIALQDHGDVVSFRNVKILELK
jgi:hypothetical protein